MLAVWTSFRLPSLSVSFLLLLTLSLLSLFWLSNYLLLQSKSSYVIVSSQSVTKNTVRLCGLNNKHPFLTVLEASQFKIKVLADLVSGEDGIFSLSPRMAEGVRELTGVTFIRALIQFMTKSLPKGPHFLIPSHWRLKFQHMNEGHTNIQSIAPEHLAT